MNSRKGDPFQSLSLPVVSSPVLPEVPLSLLDLPCGTPMRLFTLGDALSFLELTSKIPPLGSMLNFDADVKTRPHVTQCENSFVVLGDNNICA